MAKQEEEVKSGLMGSGFYSYSHIQQTHLEDDDEFSIGPGSESLSFWQTNYQNKNRGSFVCEGLSLSVSPDDPSAIGIQPFEHHQQVQVQTHDDEFENILKSSKYLFSCKELLNELCCAETKQTSTTNKDNNNNNKYKEGYGDESRQHQQSLFGLHLMEPHLRKIKLIALLEELNTRYKSYKDQIESTARQFESAAGTGSTYAYTSSASKAMSRHFRCLRDALVGQIKAAAAASDGGETTPRLKALDLAIRQRKALQQEVGTTASQPWRPPRGLPEKSVSVLRAWLFDHFLHPYPGDADKHILARQTGLSRSQVSNWFINARVRLWKPMVEEMYLEETKEEQPHCNIPTLMNPQTMFLQEDQKPSLDQTLDFSSLSAIVSGGTTSLDFSLYNNEGNLGVSSVSLTLGLQRDGQPGSDFCYSLFDG